MCHGDSSGETIYKGTFINALKEQIPYCPMWSQAKFAISISFQLYSFTGS